MTSEDVSYLTCYKCAKLFEGSRVKRKYTLHMKMCKGTLTKEECFKKAYKQLANKSGMSVDQYADAFVPPKVLKHKQIDGKQAQRSYNVVYRYGGDWGADGGFIDKNKMRSEMCGFCYDTTTDSYRMDCGQIEPAIVCKSCVVKSLTHKRCDFCDNDTKAFVKPVEIDGKKRWACVDRCYDIYI